MRLAWILLLSISSGCAADPAPAPPPSVGGASRAFVADEDDGAIVELDLDGQKVEHVTTFGARVRDVLVLSDGRLAATRGGLMHDGRYRSLAEAWRPFASWRSLASRSALRRSGGLRDATNHQSAAPVPARRKSHR
jgi:hypothetical protein